MDAYKRDMVVVIKMGAYIHGGAYFVWVLIFIITIIIKHMPRKAQRMLNTTIRRDSTN